MHETFQKICQLNQQAWSDRNKDVQKSLDLARQVQCMLGDLPETNVRELALSLRTQGYCLEHLSRYGEALTITMKAMDLTTQLGDARMIASLENGLGSIYWRLADYSSALEHYLNGLDLLQTEPDPELETFLLQGLGALHMAREEHEQALKYFKLGAEAARPEDIVGRAIGLNNVAYTLHEMKRDEEGLPYALEALALFGQGPFTMGKLEVFHTLGSIYLELGEEALASQYFEEAAQTAEFHNNPLQRIDALFGICRIHQLRGELDDARQKLHLILQISEQIQSLPCQCRVHELLAKLYKDTGRYAEALEEYEAFRALHMQMFNEQSERLLHNTRVLHEVETIRKQANLYRTLAATDSLTGLLNRREFFESGAKIITQARSEQLPVSLLMIDLDHFKFINDQYGHAVGDQVLAAVAGRLKKSLRERDLAGRYGGDEFVILMPDIGVVACQKVATRCQWAVAEEPVEVNSLKLQMNISIGFAVLDGDSSLSLEELIQRADRALLCAKKNGRNQLKGSDPV